MSTQETPTPVRIQRKGGFVSTQKHIDLDLVIGFLESAVETIDGYSPECLGLTYKSEIRKLTDEAVFDLNQGAALVDDPPDGWTRAELAQFLRGKMYGEALAASNLSHLKRLLKRLTDSSPEKHIVLAVEHDKPVRIQRKRTKGFRLQDASPNGLPVVCVTRPGKWGNPFIVGDGKGKTNQRQAVEEFERWLLNPAHCSPRLVLVRERMLNELHELRGKNLACWCEVGQLCHADVLLKMANDAGEE